ncbi:hypothetical protein [Parasitella parasitica]|uniref:Uncharacterized protein n=1 Tax=Parasitella parasitica TaxID=35722 RepID=A0A0B7NS18_9FUNG|nr:hypothetical protein [Parasitella parasitica]
MLITEIKLRDYQQKCIDVTLENIRSGNYKQLVCLPTGSGKTVIISNLIPLIPSAISQATKVLVLENRIELLHQVKAQISTFNPELDIQIEQSQNYANPLTTDVVVATVQTLIAKDTKNKSKTRLERFDPKEFKAVIVDEAHHAASKSYMEVLNYFGVFRNDSNTLLWGCTATPIRHDKLSLPAIFGPVLFQLDFMEMINQGYLSNLKFATVYTQQKKVNQGTYLRLVVNSWKQLALEKHRKFTLVFAKNIREIQDLCNAFRNEGIKANFVTATTAIKNRELILEDFKCGKLQVLVNCEILIEGIDIPQVDCILLTRRTNSASLFKQIVGRGSRLYKGKQDCLVIDFERNFERLFVDREDDTEVFDIREKVFNTLPDQLFSADQLFSERGEVIRREIYDEIDVTIKHYQNLRGLVAEMRQLQKEAEEMTEITDSGNESVFFLLVEKIKKLLEDLRIM